MQMESQVIITMCSLAYLCDASLYNAMSQIYSYACNVRLSPLLLTDTV